jgi:dolichol kinase
MAKKHEKKLIIKELTRKTMHIIIGTAITLLAYFELISYIHILLVVGIMTLFSLLHAKKPLTILEKFLVKVDRKDIIPAYGAIMLGLGIGLSFLLFPRDIALISGISVSLIDGFSTIIALFSINNNGKRKGIASLSGTIIAFAFLTSFFTHIHLLVILSGVIVGGMIDLMYDRIWLLDDNLVMPLFVGLTSFIVMIILVYGL